MKLFKIFGLLISLTVLSSCGGKDPLSLINNVPFTPLETIIPNTGGYTALATPFTSATPYWRFSVFNSFNYVSPGNGFVSEIGTDSGLTFIKIIHTGLLSTKIYGLSTVVVRDGDAVATGQTIGILGTDVRFQVLVDDTPVCPLSYMSATFRQNFYSGITSNPCQN